MKPPPYTLYKASRAVPNGKGAVYKQEIVLYNERAFFRTEGKREIVYSGGSFTKVQWKSWKSVPQGKMLFVNGYIRYKNSIFTLTEWDGKLRRLPKTPAQSVQESVVVEYTNDRLTQALKLLNSLAQSV